MKDRDVLPVVDEHAPPLGANQKMAGSSRQNRRDGACLCVVRENLTESAAIEGKQPVVGRGKDKFRFAGVGQNGGSQRDQRRSGKLAADGILVEQRTSLIIFEQSGRAGHIKMILETGGLEEYCGRTDGFEIGIPGGGERPNHEADFVFRADVLGRRMECPRGSPQDSRSEPKGQEETSRNCGACRDDGYPSHDSCFLKTEL